MANTTHNGVGQRMTLSKTWQSKTCKSCKFSPYGCCDCSNFKQKACPSWTPR